MSKLRAAVVGVGYLGQFHAQKYKNNNLVELVGVCDAAPVQADRVASTLNVDSYYKPQDLIGKVDMVTVAASTQAHYEVAKILLEGGVHVNVEKPITATVAQAEELIEIAARKKVILSVGHIERFNPACVEIKKNAEKFKMIELRRMATFKSRGADVSVLHDLMIHDIDLMLWISGSEIESFVAGGAKVMTDEIDTATAAFKMKNGWTGHITVSRVAAIGDRSARLVGPKTVWNVNTGALEIEETLITNVETDPLKFVKRTLDKRDALQSETDAFIDSVANNKPAQINGHDGLHALKWVEAIKESILR